MTIQYLGLKAFRLQFNGKTVLLDPYDDKSGLKPIRSQHDIVLLSSANDQTKYSAKEFTVDCPGEYEIGGIFIYGIPINGSTFYILESEGLKIAHLNGFNQDQFTQQQLERLENIDILMIPVGGENNGLTTKRANAIINQLEPRVVIPMNYKLPKLKNDLEPVENFVKEVGAEFQTVEKLKISKKDLPEEETDYFIIKPEV